MRTLAGLMVVTMVALPVHAQRDAVSPDLSPEAAASVFQSAVATVCVPAVTGNGVSGVTAAQQGKLRPTQDAETRKQAGASPDETVWDVMDGKGVVTVREKPRQCVVSVYGAPAKAAVAGVSETLASAPGVRGISTTSVGDLKKTVTFEVGPRTVQVQVAGSEPGSPGHQSRFSVVTATVTRAQ